MPTSHPSPDEDRAVRQARRMRAAELFAQGRSQAEVARELGVSRESARRWHARWQTGGAQALASRGRTGPAPKISDARLPAIEQALLQGATAAGFDNDLWTLERIAVVIERLTRGAAAGRLGVAVVAPAAGLECATARAARQGTRRRGHLSGGSPTSGPGSKRGARKTRMACLLRRIRHLPDPGDPPDLGATRPHADPAAPVCLAAGVHGRGAWLSGRRQQSPAVR
jgi:transposase